MVIGKEKALLRVIRVLGWRCHDAVNNLYLLASGWTNKLCDVHQGQNVEKGSLSVLSTVVKTFFVSPVHLLWPPLTVRSLGGGFPVGLSITLSLEGTV